jgi:hypothetical protein
VSSREGHQPRCSGTTCETRRRVCSNKPYAPGKDLARVDHDGPVEFGPGIELMALCMHEHDHSRSNL